MELKDLIRNAREAKGWRQEDLAEAVSVTKQAVQQWEAGETSPRGSRLLRLSNALGVSLDEAAPPPRRVISFGPKEQSTMNAIQLIEVLRERLPDDLKFYAGGAMMTKHLRVVFPYASRRVIAHAMYGTPTGASRIKLRSAAWRMAAAMLGTGDVNPASHHYLLVALELPDHPGSATLPEPMALEGRLAGIAIETLKTIDDFIARIVELEQTQTEAEIYYENIRQNDNYEDMV